MNIKDVGSLIKKRRLILKIDQRQLSELSGASLHTISNIESGKGNPTIEILSRILDLLGMELKIDIKG